MKYKINKFSGGIQMANKKLLDKAEQLGLEPVKDESDEDLVARINEVQNEESQSREEFDPTEEADEPTREELVADGKCPDCKGQGIRNPAIDHQVCQTCEGTGKA